LATPKRSLSPIFKNLNVFIFESHEKIYLFIWNLSTRKFVFVKKNKMLKQVQKDVFHYITTVVKHKE